jgi:hypothetical protein
VLLLVKGRDAARLRRAGLDCMLHPTEIALLLSLTRAIVSNFIVVRTWFATSGADPYTSGPLNQVILLVAEHHVLLSSLAGGAMLLGLVALLRRAGPGETAPAGEKSAL